MKQMNQNGFGLVVVLAVTIVVLAVGILGWQINKNNAQPKTETPTSSSEANNDCGSNRECFSQAFSSNCTQKTIKTTQTTIEGDLIITTAKVAQGFEGCIVEVTVDSSQDKFGDGKVHTYTCEKLALDSQALIASVCKGSTETSSITI